MRAEGTLFLRMKTFRTLVVLLVAAVALSLAVTLALAAPTALSPTRSAAAAEYCPPGERQARQAAVRRAQARLATAQAQLRGLRARRPKAAVTAQKARSVAALQKQLRSARARLARCD